MTNCGCGQECKCQENDKKKMECDCDVIHEELVLQAKEKMIDEEILLDIADFYKALCDSTRVKIINLLDNNNELCVCDISVLLNMTKSAVSHQLRYLRDMNLIKSQKKGKEVWYSLADKHVKEVFDVSLEHILESKDEQNSKN